MKRGRPKLILKGLSSEQIAEVDRCYKRAKDWHDRERLRAVKLAIGGGHSYEEIAEKVGRARSCVQKWMADFRAGGVDQLLRKAKNRGRKSRMTEEAKRQLLEKISAGEFRTVWQAKNWLNSEFSLNFTDSGARYWMKKLGAKLKVPRQSHVKKKPEAQQEFKANFLQKLRDLRLPKGSKRIKIWVQDEARYGLHSFVRRVWSLPGTRVLATSQQKFQWGYVYGALECSEGDAVFAYLPTVSLEAMALFCQQIIKTDPDAEHILIADNAGFHHKPGDSRLPKNLHILPLPAYSPELNPVEKLWDQMKDRICNQAFASIADVEEKITPLLQQYWSNPKHTLQLVGNNNFLHLKANSS